MGRVLLALRRETDQFHGAGYDYYFAGNMGANTWQGNHTPSGNLKYTPLPSTHQNRFGASLGGPLTPSFWGARPISSSTTKAGVFRMSPPSTGGYPQRC